MTIKNDETQFVIIKTYIDADGAIWFALIWFAYLALLALIKLT